MTTETRVSMKTIMIKIAMINLSALNN